MTKLISTEFQPGNLWFRLSQVPVRKRNELAIVANSRDKALRILSGNACGDCGIQYSCGNRIHASVWWVRVGTRKQGMAYLPTAVGEETGTE